MITDAGLVFSGLSSDSAVHSDLHPRRGPEAHHAVSPKPSAASVRPAELRVRLPHPGRDAERDGAALQQLQHPVPEKHRELH